MNFRADLAWRRDGGFRKFTPSNDIRDDAILMSPRIMLTALNLYEKNRVVRGSDSNICHEFGQH